MKTIQKQNNIQESFDITLKDENLKNMAIDLSEISIDGLIEDGTLKDLPIVGTIANLIRFGANVKDRLFLKKIVSFLNELKDISPKERKKIIDQIDNSKKYRIKVGEKLLYIIDNCNDYINSELVAQLFKNFIEKKISYEDFLRCSNIVEKITDHDFKWFLKDGSRSSYIEDVLGSLISSGLFDLQDIPVGVDIEEDHKITVTSSKYKADVDGGGISVSLSNIGRIMMEIFNSEYKKPKSIKI